MHEVLQLFCGFHFLHGTEVDAAEHNMVFLRRFDVCLQRRLTIQFDGEVNDAATLHQTVGRCVGPTSGDIDPDGTAPPNNLVVGNTKGTHGVRNVCVRW